jgi:hypothetical protein
MASCSTSFKKHVANEHIKPSDKYAYFKINGANTKRDTRFLGIGTVSNNRIFLYKASEDCLTSMGAIETQSNKPSKTVKIPMQKIVFKLFRRVESSRVGGTFVNYEDGNWGYFDPKENTTYSFIYDNTSTKGITDMYVLDEKNNTRIDLETEKILKAYLFSKNGEIWVNSCD